MAKVPSEEECMDIMMKNDMPDNVIGHSRAVKEVAMFLAERLIELGEDIDRDLVRASALLHDLDKMETLHNMKHGYVSHEKLKERFPEVAEVVLAHLWSRAVDVPLDSWEKKLVYYADKRVADKKTDEGEISFNQLVSLDERIDYLKRRYGSRSEDAMKSIMRGVPTAKKIEEEIFENMDIHPDSLKEIIIIEES